MTKILIEKMVSEPIKYVTDSDILSTAHDLVTFALNVSVENHKWHPNGN